MESFKNILKQLPNVDHIKEIKLLNQNGNQSGKILNKPGSSGSIKLYNHLFLIFGELNTDAAIEGLNLYCEHVEDAKNNPGKHPNIDRLIDIIKSKETLQIKII
jgi:hypothetical protein